MHRLSVHLLCGKVSYELPISYRKFAQQNRAVPDQVKEFLIIHDIVVIIMRTSRIVAAFIAVSAIISIAIL